ncbi:MAG: hypothetical protein GXO39_08705 [Thermotogae bacterium]|nr:hypothetical protein [Thermotogota bacterium]
MEFLLFSLGLKTTFPGVVTNVLPLVVAYPTAGLTISMGGSSYASLEVGALNLRSGKYSLSLVTSSFYIGTYLNSWDVALGYSVMGAGIKGLAIEDQGYMGLLIRGGYMKRFGRVSVSSGGMVAVYPMVVSGKASILPVPFLYFDVAYGW